MPLFVSNVPKALGMHSPSDTPRSRLSKKSGRCNKSLRRRTLSSSKACANARALTWGSAPMPCHTRTEHRNRVRGLSPSSLLDIESSSSSLLVLLPQLLCMPACTLACMMPCGTQASMREAVSVANPRGVQTSPALMAKPSRTAVAAAAGQAFAAVLEVASGPEGRSASTGWTWRIR